MCVVLQVARQRCRTLVDTGASRSLMSLDTWNDICERRGTSKRLRRLEPGMTLRSLNKTEIPTMGRAIVNIYGIDLVFYSRKTVA